MNYFSIKEKIHEKLTLKSENYKDLVTELELSETGFHQMFSRETLRISVLEKIAIYLDVPITYFFDDLGTEKNISNVMYQNNNGKRNFQKNVANIGNIDYLEKTKMLQREIEHLNKIINLLEKK